MDYQTAVPIARGSTGEVFRAFDAQRGHFVALKYLHREDPLWVERMLGEALAQRSLDHPHIAKVYEAGQHEGRHFIAMQFIDGQPLDQVMQGLSRQQRLNVLLPVVEALGHAHNKGIVHRDLKPANILVERLPDGRLHPWVVDFGLARIADTTGLTLQGQVLGSPGYLSPEQARGDNAAVSPASDVFSLGVVMFEALLGRLPFQGNSSADLLLQVLTNDPPTPRSLQPDLPRALNDLLAQCLERDPARRYADANALASDVRRHLQGAEISARPAGALYRTRRFLRRHRYASAALALALTLVIAALSQALLERWRSAEIARLGQQFAAMANDAATTMHLSELLPRHELTAARQRVHRGMSAIEREIARLGPVAEGPGRHALGRAAMSMNAPGQALEHLHASLAAGHTLPEVQRDLGLAYAHLYREQLEQALNISHPEMRQQRVDALHESLASPALTHLGQAPHNDPLARVWLAWLRDDMEAMLQGLPALRDDAPWSDQADLLQATLHYRQAMDSVHRGDLPGAAQTMAEASSVLHLLSERARSNARAYRNLCLIATQRLIWATEGYNEGMDDPAELLLPCEQALEIRPDGAAELQTAAAAYWRMARLGSRSGGEWQAPLARARELIDQALQHEPDSPSALINHSQILQLEGEFAMAAGEDASDTFLRAAQVLEQAQALSPGDAFVHSAAGIAWFLVARNREAMSESPLDAFAHSVQQISLASNLLGDSPSLLSNLGAIRSSYAQALMSRGLPAADVVHAAIADLQGVLAVRPDHLSALNNLGLAWRALAQLAIDGEEDPATALQQSAEAFQAALQLQPQRINALINLAAVQGMDARYRLDSALDAHQQLLSARQNLNQALTLLDGREPEYCVRAQLETLEARQLQREGLDPATKLAQAGDLLQRGRQLASLHRACLLAWADLAGHFPKMVVLQAPAESPPGQNQHLPHALQQMLADKPDDLELRLRSAELHARLAEADGEHWHQVLALLSTVPEDTLQQKRRHQAWLLRAREETGQRDP